MNGPTVECSVHFRRRGRGGRRELAAGLEPVRPPREPGRIPRVARLMALALRFEEYLRSGQVSTCSELAELGHVTRARISQIMNLLNLAPEIQEAILFLPRTLRGRDAIILRDLQPIAIAADWQKQRCIWQEMVRRNALSQGKNAPPTTFDSSTKVR